MSVREFRDRYARGGYWWTMEVNQTLASGFVRSRVDSAWRPNHLTLANGVIGLATSGAFLALHEWNLIVAAVIGFAGWQLAYTCDCADGQMARSQERTSPNGFILDLLVDFTVQLSVVGVLAYVAARGLTGSLAAGLGAFWIGGWLISPFYSGILNVLPSSPPRARPWYEDLVRQLRDYGLHLAVLPLLALVGTDILRGALVVIAILNFLALLRGVVSHSGLRRSQS